MRWCVSSRSPRGPVRTPVLFVAEWNRDLARIVPGVDPFDVYLPQHAGSLPVDERFLDVVHDPTGSFDPVRNREEFVRVKERAEHKHRPCVVLIGPPLPGPVEGLPDSLPRTPKDMQGVFDSRPCLPGRAWFFGSRGPYHRVLESDAPGLDFGLGASKPRTDSLAALEPQDRAHLGGADAARGCGKAFEQVESPPAAEDLGASGEFCIGGGHSGPAMLWRGYRREPRAGFSDLKSVTVTFSCPRCSIHPGPARCRYLRSHLPSRRRRHERATF